MEAERDCQEHGGIKIERWLLIGAGFLVWDDAKVLKLDSGDEPNSMNILKHWVTHSKSWVIWCVNCTSTQALIEKKKSSTKDWYKKKINEQTHE